LELTGTLKTIQLTLNFIINNARLSIAFISSIQDQPRAQDKASAYLQPGYAHHCRHKCQLVISVQIRCSKILFQ